MRSFFQGSGWVSQNRIYNGFHFVSKPVWLLFFSNCSWTTWSSWSICSKTCGDTSGYKTRTRHQSLAIGIGDHCNKTETEMEKCLLNKCPVDCTWSTWTDWSKCSQSCGSGLRTRSRIVSEPEKFGGKSCLDSYR